MTWKQGQYQELRINTTSPVEFLKCDIQQDTFKESEILELKSRAALIELTKST